MHYTLIPTAAVAAVTPTALPADCPPFAALTAVRVVVTGEGSGTAATVVNPSSATVKNVVTMPATPGATEFDFDRATFEWQYGAASGPQSTGTFFFELDGLLEGEVPAMS